MDMYHDRRGVPLHRVADASPVGWRDVAWMLVTIALLLLVARLRKE